MTAAPLSTPGASHYRTSLDTKSCLGSEPAAHANMLDLGSKFQRILNAYNAARRALQVQQQPDGHWTGQLSTSALSTATAISALSLVRTSALKVQSAIFPAPPSAPPFAQSGDRSSTREVTESELLPQLNTAISVGCRWLMNAQNRDGGFGDTDLSHSNVATTYLVLAAWQLAGFNGEAGLGVERAHAYCHRLGGWDALRRRYGTDKTFVVPILTNCALAGLASWDDVSSLPFEAAWLPQSWYRLAQMPVVSYAIPALVSIGQAKFYHRPPRNPLVRAVRRAAIEPTLNVLAKMQPSSGGYLEAVPLTSFVLMSLAGTERASHPVAKHALRFLIDSRLSDGSWPIDTNLATWTTSLSLSALSYVPTALKRSTTLGNEQQVSAKSPIDVTSDVSDSCAAKGQQTTSDIAPQSIRWLLSCQHLAPHPFTGAQPGGWGWSNLSGAVPDADDTPAALLALARWIEQRRGEYPMLDEQIARAVALGLRWLVRLQNRDGGWPTFCRGWGKLPFDRSGCDLTAHALRAIAAWEKHRDLLERERETPSIKSLERATDRGFRFLAKHQRDDGSWIPLWFGNQDRSDEDNPVYGTARVLLAYAECGREGAEMSAGVNYLVTSQNADGGWGGGASVPYRVGIGGSRTGLSNTGPSHTATSQGVGSSIEETGAALEALVACGSESLVDSTIMNGLDWIIEAVERGYLETSWPIGFYFAKLWYHERLYPFIAATAALGSAVTTIANRLDATDSAG